jgi:hypothetical protein
MEKMLSLPVTDGDDGLAFPQEVVTPAPATLSATLTLLREASAREEAAHAALNPPHLTLPPPAPMPQPLTNDVAPPSVMEKLEPLLAAIPEQEAPLSTQWGYLPLVAINVTFDYATMILGGAGAWMRTEWGRLLLGLSGAAMLLAAAIWFVKDWLGWTW